MEFIKLLRIWILDRFLKIPEKRLDLKGVNRHNIRKQERGLFELDFQDGLSSQRR